MTNLVVATKDENSQQPVPSAWRKTLTAIADRFALGDYTLSQGLPGVQPVADDDAKWIASSIAAYGEPLVDLPDTTWETSVCQWQTGYWEVLVDLHTRGGPSDLVLFVRVHDDATAPQGYRFQVRYVIVP